MKLDKLMRPWLSVSQFGSSWAELGRVGMIWAIFGNYITKKMQCAHIRVMMPYAVIGKVVYWAGENRRLLYCTIREWTCQDKNFLYCPNLNFLRQGDIGHYSCHITGCSTARRRAGSWSISRQLSLSVCKHLNIYLRIKEKLLLMKLIYDQCTLVKSVH